MKKIILIILMFTSISFGEVLDQNREYIDNIGQKTIFINYDQDDHAYLLFVQKTSVYLMDVLEMEVKTVEAHIIINAKSTTYSKLKAVIVKDGQRYVYNIVDDLEYLPLQMGSGKYDVNLLGSNDGRRYRKLTSKTFDVVVEDNAVFLSRSQNINWNIESDLAILAKALTLDAKSDEEKLLNIHSHIIENIKYDYKKAASLPKGYIPNPDLTLEEGQGICYDFASVLAAMMRSVEVPSKLIKGYSRYTPVYHAWNEILIDDTWWVVDASTDSIFLDNNVKYVVSKSVDDYLTSKEY